MTKQSILYPIENISMLIICEDHIILLVQVLSITNRLMDIFINIHTEA